MRRIVRMLAMVFLACHCMTALNAEDHGPSGDPDFVKIVHIGKSDKSIVSMVLFDSISPSSKFTSKGEWHFGIEHPVFQVVVEKVIAKKHVRLRIESKGIAPFGTFEVEYKGSSRRVKFTLKKDDARQFLEQINDVGKELGNADFHRILDSALLCLGNSKK